MSSGNSVSFYDSEYADWGLLLSVSKLVNQAPVQLPVYQGYKLISFNGADKLALHSPTWYCICIRNIDLKYLVRKIIAD